MKKWLLFAAVLVTIVSLGVTAATIVSYADCGLTAGGLNGGTVECPTNDADGYEENLRNGSLDVSDGVTVDNPADDGIDIGNNNTVTIGNATVSGSDDGLEAGNDLTLTNDGDITGGDAGIVAGNRANITNNGNISGDDLDGIEAGGNATITNNVGGVISSVNEDGIDVLDRAVINNFGTVTSGGDDGIDADSAYNVEITNHAGAIIAADEVGIELGEGTITNSGLITGSNEAILLSGDSGHTSITNNGTITGRGGIFEEEFGCGCEPGGQDQTIINNGTIDGQDRAAINLEGGQDTIINTGTIIGTIRLGDSRDEVTLSGNSVLDGNIRMNEGNDTLTVERGATATGVLGGGSGGQDLLNLALEVCTPDQIATFFNFGGEGVISGANRSYSYNNFELLNLDESVISCEELLRQLNVRINWPDTAAPVALFCEGNPPSMVIYQINPSTLQGTPIINMPGTELAPKVSQATSSGVTVEITSLAGVGVYALPSGLLQILAPDFNGTTYVSTFAGDICQ